jgi:hypothetical protein
MAQPDITTWPVQKSDIWSKASYRYTISWEAFLDQSDSYFLFADLVGFYTHWTYLHIFRHIFLSNNRWQRSDIWSQASYRYPISWEALLDPSDSYFLFADERGFHKWVLAHSSSCFVVHSPCIHYIKYCLSTGRVNSFLSILFIYITLRPLTRQSKSWRSVFIGRGNLSTRRKPPTCRKSLSNLIT